MTEWEYLTEQYRTIEKMISDPEKGEHPIYIDSWQIMRDDLPAKGHMGWELVSVVSMIGNVLVAVFKRNATERRAELQKSLEKALHLDPHAEPPPLEEKPRLPKWPPLVTLKVPAAERNHGPYCEAFMRREGISVFCGFDKNHAGEHQFSRG